MTHLLDTNICSAFLRRPGGLAHRFFQHSGGLAIPTIVLAELYAWAYLRTRPEPLLKALDEDFVLAVAALPFDQAAARRFGKVRAALQATGVGASPVDLMIAAVALEHDLTLVTHNVKHFAAVPGLRIDDWLSP